MLAKVEEGAGGDATVESVLLRHCAELLPSPGSDVCLEQVRRARQLARMVVGLAGDRPAKGFDADGLEDLRGELVSTQDMETLRFRSHDRVGRAISQLRAALNVWRATQGLEPIEAKRTNQRARRRDGNYSVPLRLVHDLIHRARPAERALIALAVSTGVLDRETRQLGHDDFHLATPRDPSPPALFMRIPDPGDPTLERWIAVPGWVRELLNDLPRHGDLLFPRGSAPALGQTLRRLRRADDVVLLTPRLLRVTFQGVARMAGGSRQVVRGTWRQPAGTWPGQWHPGALEHWKLALRWERFVDGPAAKLLDRRVLVPRRAPAHCRPDAPERSPRKKRPAPLPPGMRGLPPGPVEPPPATPR